MLDLIETIAGGVLIAVYLGIAVVLPAAVAFLFARLIATLLRLAVDPAVAFLPYDVRSGVLAPFGRWLRDAGLRLVGVLLLLALVGAATAGLSPTVVQDGFGQLLVTFAAIGDIVATWMTGRVLNDMLVELQPAPGEAGITSLRLLENLIAQHLFTTLRPGVTNLAFRWTFAAFVTGIAGVYLVLEPLRALRRRVAGLIAPAAPAPAAGEESLERQAELIAQLLARAAPAAPAAPPPAPAVQWARPGAAQPAARPPTPAAPAAIPSHRVAIVTWDGELATEMERQLDGAGFAPLVLRSVAEAFSSRTWPELVFIDARHLRWLAPDRLPLLVRARLVAVTREGLRVPPGWQLDTHALESGADALLELLRRRDARRKGSV